jgi:hypothetical protein
MYLLKKPITNKTQKYHIYWNVLTDIAKNPYILQYNTYWNALSDITNNPQILQHNIYWNVSFHIANTTIQHV